MTSEKPTPTAKSDANVRQMTVSEAENAPETDCYIGLYNETADASTAGLMTGLLSWAWAASSCGHTHPDLVLIQAWP